MARFPIDITARDRTGDAISKIGEAFTRLTKGSGFEKLGRSFEHWSRSSRSMGEAWKAIGALGDQAAGAAGGLGEAAEGAAGLGVAAGGAALGIGAVVVGLAAAADQAVKFETAYSALGRQIGINSQLLGISARDLQIFQGAGVKAGVTADQMTGALQGLGQHLRGAAFGGDTQTLNVLNRLGVRIKFLKDGSVDTKSGMLDLAAAMQHLSPQAREAVAAQLGVSGALAFLSQNLQQTRKDMDDVVASGAVMTDKQIADSERFQRSLAGLGEKWQALKNIFAEKIAFPFASAIISDLSSIAGWLQKAIDLKLRWDQVLKGGAAVAAATAAGPLAPVVGVAVMGINDQINRARAAFGGSNAAPASPAGAAANTAAPASAATIPGAPRAQPPSGRLPLGLRLNNPGNLRPAGGSSGFRSFGSLGEGIGAMARQLLIYQDRHGLNTISGIIGRYAPAGVDRNSTGSYIKSVSRWTGFDPNQPLNLHDRKTLANVEAAMIRYEQGRKVVDADQVAAVLGGQNPAQQANISGQVNVNVHLGNAPKGTVASVSGGGRNLATNVSIGHAMAGPA